MAVQRERYPAIVTSIDDDQKRGRVFVKCLQITGDDDQVYPEPIEPSWDWGWFYVPDVGEEIEIEVVVSDDQEEDTFQQAFLEYPQITWRSKRHASQEGEAPRLVNSLFTEKNYGKRRGFATPTGHVMMFDDTDGDEQVLLTWKKNGAEEYAFLSFDKDGSAILSNKNGSMVYLNAADGEIMIADEHGNSISTADTGIKVIDQFSNVIELKDGVVQVLAQGDANITAGGNVVVDAGSDVQVDADGDCVVTCVQATIDADTYSLGKNADSALVRWVELEPWLNGHGHPDAFGGTGPANAGTMGPVPVAAASTIGTLR